MEDNKKSRQEYQRNYYYKNREQLLLKIINAYLKEYQMNFKI